MCRARSTAACCEADEACIYPGGVTFKEQEGQVPNPAQEGTT
jgi:hypothetical protein